MAESLEPGGLPADYLVAGSCARPYLPRDSSVQESSRVTRASHWYRKPSKNTLLSSYLLRRWKWMSRDCSGVFNLYLRPKKFFG